MRKAIATFVIILAVLVALLGTTFSLTGFLSSFTTELELLEFSSINIPSFPSYTPSQDANAMERIAYFFTDFTPNLVTFIGNFIAETIKLVYYPLINAFRITQWLFNLF